MAKPKIRFKGYTDDWEQRKLGDLRSVAMVNQRYLEEEISHREIFRSYNRIWR